MKTEKDGGDDNQWSEFQVRVGGRRAAEKAPYAVKWSGGGRKGTEGTHKKIGGLEKPRRGMLPFRGNRRRREAN